MSTTTTTTSTTSTTSTTNNEFSAVYVTAPDESTAQLIAKSLVESKLAACVNLIPSVKSIYMWEGKLEESQEVLMMIKTRTERLDALITLVKSKHPYQVPEVISVPIDKGNPAYLDWIRDSTATE